MMMNISDWVQGKTKEDEMIYGFVEAIDSLKGVATVHVVKSDNEDRVGRRAAVRTSWIKPVPESTFQDSGLLQDVIDLALATRDEAWFMELTEGLKSGRQTVAEGETHPEPFTAFVNRLGKFV